MPDPTNEPNPIPPSASVIDLNASQQEQILGIAAKPDPIRESIPAKWQRFYDQLVAKRDALIDATGDLQSKAREVSPDPLQDSPAEVGTQDFQRDQLLGTVTYDQEILTEISEAITRMQYGTYGTCEATGQQIPEARLAAVPWTRFTAEAQADMEARGQATKAAIGPRGDMKERGTAPAGPWRDKEGST